MAAREVLAMRRSENIRKTIQLLEWNGAIALCAWKSCTIIENISASVVFVSKCNEQLFDLDLFALARFCFSMRNFKAASYRSSDRVAILIT
jgi:hypothetical protein